MSIRKLMPVLISTATILFTYTGCSRAPVKGTFLSGEKNIWIEDMDNKGVIFCESNVTEDGADPVCHLAHWSSNEERPYLKHRNNKSFVNSGASAIPVAPAANAAPTVPVVSPIPNLKDDKTESTSKSDKEEKKDVESTKKREASNQKESEVKATSTPTPSEVK